MDEAEQQVENQHLLPLLEALKKASKDLQSNPISIIYNNYDISTAIEALLELGTKADPVISVDPSLFKLNQLLSNLKTLFEKLEKLQGYGLRSLLHRQITNYKISQIGYAMEAEIQAYVDQKDVQSFVKTMEESVEDDKKVKALMGLENRLGQGFDKQYQQLILRAKVFSFLEFMVCDSKFSNWVRDQAALAVLDLVKFNKDVFVGLVLMGPIIRALIQMGSSCSIQVLTGLVKIIRTPLVDDINGEIPRIISLLGSEDLSTKVAAMNCILEIAFLGREEVIGSMLEEDLIKKLMGLQRLEVGLQSNVEENGSVFVEEREPKMEESVEKFPFSRCVASFAVQVEVGEGLEQSEKRAFKLEILKRVREASVSDAEAATVVAEVLWGSSP
ncbi:unnamed protein product [Prunus armeniaca]|uniref:Nucleotide exchange factor Fes1 domain-containing protein n=1 Tax=Prunus armeniaca TaxID=36596 RepID=A0A6J5WBE1_PRUAR|nr:unnamed protein product [Prunus armeniaca]CAB4297345.1 unnamed protein product [Prunus armeniaca]